MSGNGDIDKLSGQNRKALREAIISAYPSTSKLKIMVNDELESNLDTIAGGSDLEEVVFYLIKWAESKDKIKELLKAACKGNPDNPKLKTLRKEWYPKLSDNIERRDEEDSAIAQRWDQDLLPILSEIDLPIISDICRDTIKNLKQNIDFVANYGKLENIINLGTIKKILLENSTPPVTEAQTIVQFVERLLNSEEVKGYEDEKKNLRQCIETIAKEHNIKLPTYQKKKSSNNLQCYLLVTATPKGNYEFDLEAELIVGKESNYDKFETSCKLSEIANNIESFLEECIRKQHLQPKKNNSNLTIELFMPLQYLDKNIDTQELDAGFKQRRAIGREYRFVLRSRERVTEKSGKFIGLLHDRFKNLSNQFDYIPPKKTYQKWDWVNCNLEILENNWGKKENNIFGINILCGLPENYQVKREFFITMIRAGVPMCLWTRRDDLVKIEEDFDKICTGKLKSLNDLDDLFKSVHEIRKEAHAQTNKQDYLGYHLGFLCDNPYRIPSCLDPESELIEVGE